ncbi:unnamed protein product [Sphagnum tenellum]
MFRSPSMRYLIEVINLNEEHWMVIEIFGQETAVGWRRDKDARNKSRHRGLTLADGLPVIDNQNSKRALQYVGGQEREIYAGFGAGSRKLFVVIQWVDEGDFPAFRMISVRDYEKRDRYQFDMNEDMNDPTIDPDNPPLTGNEVWIPAREGFLASYAKVAARIAARKKSEKAQSDAAEPAQPKITDS